MKIKLFFAGILLMLAIGCAGKRTSLFMPIYTIHQENMQLMICRTQTNGTRICEYTMEFCEDDELICIPKKYLEKR